MSSDSSDSTRPYYNRVILKLSGESLAHAGERGISMDEVTAIAQQIKSAHAKGCQIAVVVGEETFSEEPSSRARAVK